MVLHRWSVSGSSGGGERATREVITEAKQVDGVGCVGDSEGKGDIRHRGVLTTKGWGYASSLWFVFSREEKHFIFLMKNCF
ncbi:hypothetical protein U1Q18_018373 [Sarracenia purpurea var. burkii]